MKLGNIPNVMDIGPAQADNVHGTNKKSLIVLHETVSPDYAGWQDIVSVSNFLDNKDFGIHGIVDLEGHIAWSYRLGKAIFYHAASGSGRVNTRSIGIELVSRVMLDKPDNLSRWRTWWRRSEQIEATAKLLATVGHFHGIPLVYSDTRFGNPGVTSHWEVSERWLGGHGHWDCWPKHRGGYFPMQRVLQRAQYYRDKWYG